MFDITRSILSPLLILANLVETRVIGLSWKDPERINNLNSELDAVKAERDALKEAVRQNQVQLDALQAKKYEVDNALGGCKDKVEYLNQNKALTSDLVNVVVLLSVCILIGLLYKCLNPPKNSSEESAADFPGPDGSDAETDGRLGELRTDGLHQIEENHDRHDKALLGSKIEETHQQREEEACDQHGDGVFFWRRADQYSTSNLLLNKRKPHVDPEQFGDTAVHPPWGPHGDHEAGAHGASSDGFRSKS